MENGCCEIQMRAIGCITFPIQPLLLYHICQRSLELWEGGCDISFSFFFFCLSKCFSTFSFFFFTLRDQCQQNHSITVPACFYCSLWMAQILIRNDHTRGLAQVHCIVSANTFTYKNVSEYNFFFCDLIMLIICSTSEGKTPLFTSLSKHDWKEYYFYQFKTRNINWIECHSQVYMVLTVKPGAPIYSETCFEPSVRLVTYLSSQGW